MIVPDDNVVGFDVAMDHAGGVDGGKAARDVGEDHGDGSPSARGVAMRDGPRAQRFTVDEIHRDVDRVVGRADLVYADDVRVIELGHRFGFANDAVAGGGVGGGEQLQGNAAIELWFPGGVDAAHGALADELTDDVATDGLAATEHARWRERARDLRDDIAAGGADIEVLVDRGEHGWREPALDQPEHHVVVETRHEILRVTSRW
jgi:hypothetical protein